MAIFKSLLSDMLSPHPFLECIEIGFKFLRVNIRFFSARQNALEMRFQFIPFDQPLAEQKLHIFQIRFKSARDLTQGNAVQVIDINTSTCP